MDYKDHLTIDSEIRFGRPIVARTRISVYDVLNWLSKGMGKQDIIRDFPELNEEKINACLAFAADRENRIRVG